MAKWGEIKCPRCEKLKDKLRNAEWRFEHLKKYGDTKDTREFATAALAELTGGQDDRVQD